MRALLCDISMDVQDLKFLVDSLAEKPNDELLAIVLRTIARAQGNLEHLAEEVKKVPVDEADGEAADAEASVADEPAGMVVTVLDEVAVGEAEKEEAEAIADERGEVAADEAPIRIAEEVKEEARPVEKQPEKERFATDVPTLGDKVCRATSIRSMLSLNDTFRFARELFGGNQSELHAVLDEAAHATSLEQAEEVLRDVVAADADEEVFAELFERVARYFNNIQANL